MPRRKVLLIEDYPVHLEVEGDALTDAGFQVVTASTEEEAGTCLEAVAKDPDEWVIILDQRLAGDELAGSRLLARVDTMTSLQSLPVLIATALSEEKVRALLGERLRHYLGKPFRPRDLVEQVRALAAG